MTSRKICIRSRFFILCPIVLVAVFLLVDRNYIPSPMIIGSSDRCDPKPGSTRSPTGSTRSPDRIYPMPASEPDSSDENDSNPGSLPPDVHLDPVKKVGDPDRLHPNPGDAPERLPLYRNLHFQEAWPAVQYPKAILPGRVSTGQDTLACCWDVKQPTNKQTSHYHCCLCLFISLVSQAVQYPRATLPGRVSTGPLTTTVAFACLFL